MDMYLCFIDKNILIFVEGRYKLIKTDSVAFYSMLKECDILKVNVS